MKEYKFNAEKEITHITNWIKDYFVGAGDSNTKAIIGISGGKDSTIAAALLVRALGSDRVIGVMMPQGEGFDNTDAQRVCDTLGIANIKINIGETCDILYEWIDRGLNITEYNEKTLHNKAITTNAPARIRMTILYSIASLYHGRVCNTGNRSELYVGYTTKYGDLAGDFALFKEYTVSEVLKIGNALNELPKDLVYKAPTDDMSGKTDEENLGFTYKQVDNLLLHGIVPEMEYFEKIKAAHKRNIHKDCIRLPAPLKSDYYHYNAWEF